MTIRGVSHVGISCTELERSRRFYRDLLGLEEVVGETPVESLDHVDEMARLPGVSGTFVMLAAPNVNLELFQFTNPAPGMPNHDEPVSRCGISHLAFEVDDVAAIQQRLAAAGVSFHSPPIEPGDGSRATYGRDPDGNVFELLELGFETPSAEMSVDRLLDR